MEIRNALKENMKKWIQEGAQMSAKIDSLKGLLPTTDNTTTSNSTSKEDTFYPTFKKPEAEVPQEKPNEKHEEE